MDKVNFVTIGDTDFFDLIERSVEQIQRYYPRASVYIYDWGLISTERRTLNSYDEVTLVNWKKKHRSFRIEQAIENSDILNKMSRTVTGREITDFHKRNAFLYRQKPYCLLDACRRIETRLIYLDGDALLTNSIDEVLNDDYDIGVTLRPKAEIEAAKARGDYHVLNAGVIFFNTDADIIESFIQEWIDVMKNTDDSLSEQTALTKIVERSGDDIYENYYNEGSLTLGTKTIRTKIFPTHKYNYYSIEDGFDKSENRVLHLKSGRYKEDWIQEILQNL